MTVVASVAGGSYNLVNDGSDSDATTISRITTNLPLPPPAWYDTTSEGHVRTAAIHHVEIAE